MDYLEYCGFLKKFAKISSPLVIVADTSNGSVGPVIKKLKLPGVKISVLNGRPDGDFPAHGPDPEKAFALKQAAAEVRKLGADFGAVFDADGDRVFFVDDLGRGVASDAAALLMSKNFKPPFVLTPTSGWTLTRALPARSFKQSPVGSFFIKEKMRSVRAEFAAETSGHYYFKFNFGKQSAYYDSALRAFVEMASRVSALEKAGYTLSSWLDSLPEYAASEELNFRVKDSAAVILRVKKGFAGKGKISTLDGLTVDGKDYRFNLRASHTEPLLRLNAEAETKRSLNDLLGELRKTLRYKS